MITDEVANELRKRVGALTKLEEEADIDVSFLLDEIDRLNKLVSRLLGLAEDASYGLYHGVICYPDSDPTKTLQKVVLANNQLHLLRALANTGLETYWANHWGLITKEEQRLARNDEANVYLFKSSHRTPTSEPIYEAREWNNKMVAAARGRWAGKWALRRDGTLYEVEGG